MCRLEMGEGLRDLLFFLSDLLFYGKGICKERHEMRQRFTSVRPWGKKKSHLSQCNRFCSPRPSSRLERKDRIGSCQRVALGPTDDSV